MRANRHKTVEPYLAYQIASGEVTKLARYIVNAMPGDMLEIRINIIRANRLSKPVIVKISHIEEVCIEETGYRLADGDLISDTESCGMLATSCGYRNYLDMRVDMKNRTKNRPDDADRHCIKIYSFETNKDGKTIFYSPALGERRAEFKKYCPYL